MNQDRNALEEEARQLARSLEEAEAISPGGLTIHEQRVRIFRLDAMRKALRELRQKIRARDEGSRATPTIPVRPRPQPAVVIVEGQEAGPPRENALMGLKRYWRKASRAERRAFLRFIEEPPAEDAPAEDPPKRRKGRGK